MPKKIREQSFSTYQFSHVVGQLALERLLEKFDWMRFDPQHILIVGLTSGQEVELLKQRFTNAKIVVVDPAFNRLREEKATQEKVQHAFQSFPFREGLFDCIFSNGCFHHVIDPAQWMQDILRLLKPGGLFLFSCYGPATLSELQTAFSRIDTYPHAADFFDMHDLGDLMKKTGYENPALDQEVLTLTYQHLADVFQDLKESGETNQHPKRRLSLMTPRQLKALEHAYEVFRNPEGRLEVSVELIYGLGWKSLKPRYSANTQGVVSIPISSITRKSV
jgi:malonyl-CoA O-methyltransferase